MRKYLAIILIGMAAVLIVSYSAYAQMYGPQEEESQDTDMPVMGGEMDLGMMGSGEMRDEMSSHHRRMMEVLMSLDLDENQKDAINGIRDRIVKYNIRKRADMQIARLELKELLGKEPRDMNAVEAKLRQIEDLRIDMALNIIKAKEEIMSKLTQEQKAKLKEAVKHNMTMSPEMMHKHPEKEKE